MDKNKGEKQKKMNEKHLANYVNEGGQKRSLNNFQGPNKIGLCFAYDKTRVWIIGFLRVQNLKMFLTLYFKNIIKYKIAIAYIRYM